MKYQNFNFHQAFILLPCIFHEISSELTFQSTRQIMLGSMDNYKNPFYMNFITPENKIELTHNTKRKRRSTFNQRLMKNITTPKDFMMQHLETTNKYRAVHGVPPLDFDYKLCLESEEWAMELVRRSEEKGSPVLLHSGKFETGENLYAEGKIANYSTSGATVAAKWYSQCREHIWNPNFFSGNSARFTQMVWKNTKRMGIALATSEKLGFTVVVARYLPCGNWGYHKSFEENVFPQTKLKDGITKCFKHKRSNNISTLQIVFPTRHTKQYNISPIANTTKKELEPNEELIVDEDEDLITSTPATESNSTEESIESDEYVYSYEEETKVSHVSRTSATTQKPRGTAIEVSKNDSNSHFAKEKTKDEKRHDKKSSAHSKDNKKTGKIGEKNSDMAVEAKNTRETSESSSSMDKKHNSTSKEADEKKKKEGNEKEKFDEIEITKEDEKKEETTEANESEASETKKKDGINNSHSKTSNHKHETDKEIKSKENNTDERKEKRSNKNIKTHSNSSLPISSHHTNKQNKSKDKKADQNKKSSHKSDSDLIKTHDKNKKTKNK